MQVSPYSRLRFLNPVDVCTQELIYVLVWSGTANVCFEVSRTFLLNSTCNALSKTHKFGWLTGKMKWSPSCSEVFFWEQHVAVSLTRNTHLRQQSPLQLDSWPCHTSITAQQHLKKYDKKPKVSTCHPNSPEPDWCTSIVMGWWQLLLYI